MSHGAPVVELRDVSLRYRLYTGRSHSLRDWLVSRVRGRRFELYKELYALRDVSVSCVEGDRLGVVGANGAGKTTLLRVIAGVFPPTKGTMRCEGRVVPLLELGLGFNGELTGRENIMLAGVLLGKTRREAKAMAPKVLEFAELKEFGDSPVKYYSSGMSARLAFSVAMETEPDVLLLDEVFAVGDIHWIKKAEERITELLERAKVVIMVSHNMGFIRRLCNRAISLDHGVVTATGSVEEVVSRYQAGTKPKEATVIDNRATSKSRIHVTRAGRKVDVRVENAPLLGECWVGVFPPGADRTGHVAWRKLSPHESTLQFVIHGDEPREIRLYRWSPAGETLEALVEVQSEEADKGLRNRPVGGVS